MLTAEVIEENTQPVAPALKFLFLLVCTMVLTNKIQSVSVIMGKVLNLNLIDVEQLECCTCVCGNNWDVVDGMIFTSCSFILDL